MITKFEDYRAELKRLKDERDMLHLQDLELVKKQNSIIVELGKNNYNYIVSEFEKRFEKIKEGTFKITDQVGIYILEPSESFYENQINVLYFKSGSNEYKSGHTRFRLSWKDNISVDDFIENVISNVQKIDVSRKKAELTRTAKKYNL